ncbi:hypothetical protein PENSTE_c008G00013 [Penicillium steckii]|uniref:Uncharacterized protein n=1 Tax=Penicillium steckii TaxID=303698 RepID=A0A1V6TCD3_9EURO|nr:hypothetical protein PENSTE_c008G00013 [Penicillium steckii]
MFSSFNNRGHLRKSMSSRSIRKPHRPPTELIDPDLAKVHAAAAASRAMHSSQQCPRPLSGELKSSYNRVGGPSSVSIPKRRPNPSIQYTDDGASTSGLPVVLPSTPLPSNETQSIVLANDHTYSAAFPPTAEPNGLDGRDSSVPSSYRRLRKAKSMFSTRHRSSHIPYSSTPPLPRRDAMDIERSPQYVLPRTMRRTPSLIRSSPGQCSRTVRHCQSQDTAIKIARNQFNKENDETQIQSRRSSLFVHRRRRETKPFRKTFHITGGSSVDEKLGDESRGRRRTFSASFKDGFKRVFGLSKSVAHQSRSSLEADPPMPPARPAPPAPVISKKNSIDRPVCENTDIRSEMPPSLLRVPNVSPSVASLCTSKSRVTSWADSTVANTVTTRKIGHRQSLSLIEEHGDLNQQFPQHPPGMVDQTSPKRSAAQRFNDWVDSHDLYSALMQQIGRQAARNPDEEITLGTVPEHRAIPARASSALSRRSRVTIRRVPSGDSSTPRSFTTARAGDLSSPRKHVVRPLQYISSPTKSQTVRGQKSQVLDVKVDQKLARSPYMNGEGSDDDTGSVIIVHHGGLRRESVSPSVYSRTTNGGTPTDIGMDSIYSVEEPGTATIFAPQRTVYKSPKRSSGSSSLEQPQLKPSMDWQKWMSSQIERIETTSPTREHVREDAQFQEEEDEIFMGMIRRAPVPTQESTVIPYVTSEPSHEDSHPIEQLTVAPQNNFSRPFSRSSSIRTILPSRNTEPMSTVKKTPEAAAGDTGSSIASPTVIRVPSERNLSPMRTRTTNLSNLLESPTPQRSVPDMAKRNMIQEQYRRYSVRRPMTNGKANSFRSVHAYRDSHTMNNENLSLKEEHDRAMDDYHRLQESHSTISSKHMVEMFLNSRRRPAEERMLESNPPGEAFV